MEYKLVIGTKDGKCHQKQLDEAQSKGLLGLKIKDTIKGDDVGFAGYEFVITGGSDNAGFPMRWDVSGDRRRKILAHKGIGLKKLGAGIRKRKTVTGNQVGEDTSQINVKVVKAGKVSVADIINPPEPAAEAPAEEKKE